MSKTYSDMRENDIANGSAEKNGQKQERVKIPKKNHPKGWRPKDTAKLEFDERLLRMVDQNKEIMKEFYMELRPECPTCHKTDTREAGTAESVLCGTRILYRCMNPDCPRGKFTIDNSSIRNLAMSKNALEMLYFGGKDMAPLAKKILRDYAISPENMPLYEHVKGLTK